MSNSTPLLDKKALLAAYVEQHKNLPEQRSQQWLDDRKFNIGGSEMGIITGDSSYKSIRDLIEQHLGLSVFKGNINTYWGSILEDYVTRILEEKWGAKSYELGSLPGVIGTQKYSPDGLMYLPFLNAIILLEIKNAARRLSNGRVPTMYKPQIFAGLDTIQIADFALFVDVMFRRCASENFCFDNVYDYKFHGEKKVDAPIALCVLVFHMPNTPEHPEYKNLSKTCDDLNDMHGFGQSEYLDLGGCSIGDLETVMGLAASKKIDVEFSPLYESPTKLQTLADAAVLRHTENNRRVIGIMPVKLFKFNITPVQRYDWRQMRKLKDMPGESYVRLYEEKINETIATIRRLDPLSPEEQLEELDKLTPPPKMTFHISDEFINELASGMMI